MLFHQAFVLVLSRIIQIFDHAIVISNKLCVEDVNIVSIAFLVFEEYSITHYKSKDCLDLEENKEATSDRYQWPSIRLRLWILGIAGSAILVLPQTQNIADGKISGYKIKAFTQQNYPDSKVFGFKVPTLDSRFNISGDIAKLGCFQFGFVVLCVNGKTNPVFQPQNFT